MLAPDWQKSNMIERCPDRHYAASEDDVEAGLEVLLAREDVCQGPVGVVALSRRPYFAIRLAAKRLQEIAAIASCYGHVQNPNAPEPRQLFSIAPEVNRIKAPVLILTGDADLELRRIVNGRAFLRTVRARGSSRVADVSDGAARAFDFRRDATPEEKIATQHARERARQWLVRHMGLGPDARRPS